MDRETRSVGLYRYRVVVSRSNYIQMKCTVCKSCISTEGVLSDSLLSSIIS